MTLTLTPTPRIHVNGVSLFVRMIGAGEPLVFLHGFTGSSRSWSPLVHVLKSHYCCISIDLLGHGNSDVPLDPARYRMEKTVADLIALFDQLGLDKVHLMGYSMGGRVALNLAIAHPKRVKSLILESTSPGLASAEERRARIKQDEAWIEIIENESIEAFMDHWERQPLFSSQQAIPEAVRAELRAQRLRCNPRGLINSMRGLGTGVQPSMWHKLDQVACPTMLMVGEFDQKFTGLALKMAAHMRNVKISIVDGAGHTIHLEKPNEFNQLLLNFLQGVRSHYQKQTQETVAR
jgi:2-succinyl-6-hydroxy-2,4-cyclohexadiene-1-carboxylate synthase